MTEKKNVRKSGEHGKATTNWQPTTTLIGTRLKEKNLVNIPEQCHSHLTNVCMNSSIAGY